MIILLYICFYLVKVSWVCQITDKDSFGKERGAVPDHSERSQWEEGDLAYILEDRDKIYVFWPLHRFGPNNEFFSLKTT